jgi:hypothetical protein
LKGDFNFVNPTAGNYHIGAGSAAVNQDERSPAPDPISQPLPDTGEDTPTAVAVMQMRVTQPTEGWWVALIALGLYLGIWQKRRKH